MKHKRSGAAASMTADGLMVTGGEGENYSTWLSSTEIFSGGVWRKGQSLPVGMWGHCQLTTQAGVVVAGDCLQTV